MEKDIVLEGGVSLHLTAERLGGDLAVTVAGGCRPHVGCVALAVPRESLTGSGETSATTSVINVTGHKDDAVAVQVAAGLAAAENCVATVSCGIHFDAITPRQMQAVMEAPARIVSEITDWLREKINRD